MQSLFVVQYCKKKKKIIKILYKLKKKNENAIHTRS